MAMEAVVVAPTDSTEELAQYFSEHQLTVSIFHINILFCLKIYKTN